jgi:hypothetical protein
MEAQIPLTADYADYTDMKSTGQPETAPSRSRVSDLLEQETSVSLMRDAYGSCEDSAPEFAGTT